MKNFKLIFSILILIPSFLFSQQNPERPKLLLGIVVDQMRYDYLDRFEDDFEEGGFNLLRKEGFYLTNLNFNYKPTYTGPGHASIFTGTVPAVHGIVANNWYDRNLGEIVYCAKEGAADAEGAYSPKRLEVETLADALRRSTDYKGKAYGIALKDRGAILPVGHSANGAYWFDGKSGKWTSSPYYPENKAEFLEKFNQADFAEQYLEKNWESQSDKYGEGDFSHDLKSLYEKEGWKAIKNSPAGNQITLDFAKELILDRQLGKDEVIDFLSISFSSTDYIGHQFGVNSAEVADTYLKLDRNLADLLRFLDREVGKGNYLFFITSDHGALSSRNFLKDHQLPHGKLEVGEMKKKLDASLDQKFGQEDWIAAIYNLNVYFNPEVKQKYSHQFEAVLAFAEDLLLEEEGILEVFRPASSPNQLFSAMEQMILKGYLAERSGELIMLEKTNWTNYPDRGSTHGSPYSYDTHVPLIFYGKGVKSGKSNKAHQITDIAATVSRMLNLSQPNSFVGNNLIEMP